MKNLSSRTAHSVRRDYHANPSVLNLATVLALPAHGVSATATAARKHTYYLDLANAARVMRDEAISMLGRLAGYANALANVLVRFGSDLSIWRYSRSFLHSRKNPGRKFHTSYKPIG
jgi:hypothetical protein